MPSFVHLLQGLLAPNMAFALSCAEPQVPVIGSCDEQGCRFEFRVESRHTGVYCETVPAALSERFPPAKEEILRELEKTKPAGSDTFTAWLSENAWNPECASTQAALPEYCLRARKLEWRHEDAALARSWWKRQIFWETWKWWIIGIAWILLAEALAFAIAWVPAGRGLKLVLLIMPILAHVLANLFFYSFWTAEWVNAPWFGWLLLLSLFYLARFAWLGWKTWRAGRF